MKTALAKAQPVRAVSSDTITTDQINLIKTQIARGCTDDELKLFMATSKRLGLDPFARQIFAVKRFDKKLGREVMTPQVSVDGMRAVAVRTGDYRGQVGPEWCGPDGKWTDVWLHDTPPAAARVGVWRRGFKTPTFGTAHWSEYVQLNKDGKPSSFWLRMGALMLAKCAESLALRKSFPNELSGVYTREEMMQASREDAPELPAKTNGKNGRKSLEDLEVENDLVAPMQASIAAIEAKKAATLARAAHDAANEDMGPDEESARAQYYAIKQQYEPGANDEPDAADLHAAFDEEPGEVHEDPYADVTCPVGKTQGYLGKPISEVPIEFLQWYLPKAEENLRDPKRARFRAQNERLVRAIKARIASGE